MKAIIETSYLKRIIKATGKFISKDEYRPDLQYIRLDFDFNGQNVTAISCDGFKISEITFPCYSDEQFTAFIKPFLPPRIAKDSLAVIEVTNENCLINIEGRIVGFKQPDGKFDIRETAKGIKNTQCELRYTFNKDYLKDALMSIDIDDEPLAIEFSSKVSPALFRTKSGFIAVLPVRDRKE